MYICNNCKETFEEPYISAEMHRELDYCVPEYFQCCPFCGSDDIEKMRKCEVCGKFILSEKDYCQHCIINGQIALKQASVLLGVDAKKALDLMEYVEELE